MEFVMPFRRNYSALIIAAIFVAVLFGWVSSAHAALPFGSPRSSEIDSSLNQLYIIDDANERLLVLDPDTLQILQELSLPSRPTSITLNESTHEIFINSLFGGDIVVFDGDEIGRNKKGDGKPKYRITDVGSPLFVKIAPTLDGVFIFDIKNNWIYLYDLTTKERRNTLFFRDEIDGWAFDSELNKLYVSSVHKSLLYRVTFPAGKTPVVSRLQPSEVVYQLAVDSRRHILLATTFTDKTIVWDTARDVEVKKVDMGRTVLSFPVCSEKIGKCYLPNFWGYSITVFDTAKRQVTKTITMSEESAHPASVTFDEDAGRVYFLTTGNYRMVMVDTAADAVIKEIPTGIVARDPSVHLKTHNVFIPNYESGTLTVVKGSDFSSRTVPELPEGRYYATDAAKPLAHPGPAVSHPKRQKTYVADLSGVLYALDSNSYRILKTLEIGEQARRMIINSAQDRLYVVSDMDSTISVVDTANDELVTRVKIVDEPVRPKREWHTALFRTLPNYIVLADFLSDDVVIFDKATNSVVKRLTGLNHVVAYATSNKGEVFVVTFLDGKVHVFDSQTFAKKREFTLPFHYVNVFGYDHLRDVIYYARGARLFAISPSDGKVLKTILLKHPGATSLAVISKLNRVYVGLRHGVEAVDIEKGEVVASWDVENHHNSLLFDRPRNIIYAYNNEVVASVGFVYGFDARSDTLVVQTPLRQIISQLTRPTIDFASGNILIPESYAQKFRVIDTKKQISKVITPAPIRLFLGLAPATWGAIFIAIALAIIAAYVIFKLRKLPIAPPTI